MKHKILLPLLCLIGFLANAQQQDIYVSPTGTMYTFSGGSVGIFGNLINDAVVGVNHNGGGVVTFYRHSDDGTGNTGNSQIYDGPSAPSPTDNYNTGGAAVRFYNLVTDNNVGTATPSGTGINSNSGSAQIQIEQEVRVSNLLTFTNGNIWTPRANWKHAFLHFDADGASYTGASGSNAKYTSPSTNMHVDGYVAKTGSSNFTFPIGDGKYARFCGLVSPASGEYKAAYFNHNAQNGTSGLSGTSAQATPMNGALWAVNSTEFWDIDGTALSQFSLDALNSVAGYSNWANDFSKYDPTKIKITAWDPWENLMINNKPIAFATDGTFATTVSTNPDAGSTYGASSPFAAYTWAVGGFNPLPINAQLFGTKKGGGNFLEWTATDAVNFKGFQLQRRDDASNMFQTIATIPYQSAVSDYNYQDNNSSGNAYYRLALEDLDGTSTYSNIVTLPGNVNGSFSVEIYPNPSYNTVYVSVYSPQPTNLLLVLMDINGREIRRYNVTASQTQTFTVDLTNLSHGVYLLNIIRPDGSTDSKKVIKM